MAGYKALLIVDAQVNMFDSPPSLYRGEAVLSTLQALIAQARAAGTPIVYVRHNGPPGDVDEPGSPGWEIHPAIAPQAEDTIVDKTRPDAFTETTLQQELESRQIQELILAGMQTDMCIDATCRHAVELGYNVTVVADGHSTFDGDETAATIVERYNRDFSTLARVVPAGDLR
ncbi:MAG TPA: cysteine hydrolase family protein [Herpetosiphonaceae bacterium]